jgi:hypothetical protein
MYEGTPVPDPILPPENTAWLDPDCIPPPMPFDKGQFEGALVDPDGIEFANPCSQHVRIAVPF